MTRNRRKNHPPGGRPLRSARTPARHIYRSAVGWGLVVGLIATAAAMMAVKLSPDTIGARGGGLGFASTALGPVAAGVLAGVGFVCLFLLLDWLSKRDL